MNEIERLIVSLRQNESRREMANLLGAEADHVHSYYICSISTAEQILLHGIRCRNEVCADSIDLSSHSVQSRRCTVWVGRDVPSPRFIRDKPVHSCVNMFWNPTNRTLESFQRNAWIRAREESAPTSKSICILEVDAEAILMSGDYYYAISGKNIATSGFSSYKTDNILKYEWDQIYSTGPVSSGAQNQARSAELVAYRSNAGNHSMPIPPTLIRRIITVPDQDLPDTLERCLSSANIPHSEVDIFKSVNNLFESERLFLDNMHRLHLQDSSCLGSLVSAFSLLVDFEARFHGPTPDKFTKSEMAFSVHGTGHVVRVMFWCAYLSTTARTASHHLVSLDALLLAALIHDLCRQSNQEDNTHGKLSREKHRESVKEFLRSDELAASCLNAIEMHCLDDEKCPSDRRDLTWSILKDADALDRGRFARPGAESGCQASMLRLSIDTKVLWLAYQLSGMTKYTNWGERPCSKLLSAFRASLTIAIENGIIHPNSLSIARELYTLLRVI